jgi:XTP/dITP diphosphohydrolase
MSSYRPSGGRRHFFVLATANPHKSSEIRDVMYDAAVGSIILLDRPQEVGEVAESASTLEGNALLKASAIAGATGLPAIADDTGLEVDALGGAPGVHSARFAGPNAADADNRLLLIEKLREVGGNEFPARFRCVMVLATQGELLGSFCGVVNGRVILEERGTGGFGYDSLFVPRGYAETFGEIQPEIKNSLSHRGRALAKVLEFLRS